jgi:RNA polymerase sigma-70 factor (ECF subfamily)
VEELASLFAEHQQKLWSLCYRMSGCAADADELVQETFSRALSRPPERRGEPWGPWLVTVALNLSRDLLRQRKRRGYVGPWLPGPVEDPAPSAGARYEATEGASYAFLLALETLTATQRAALLLREVFDYSVRETAQALQMSEGAVKLAHLRGRRALSRKKAIEVEVPRASSSEARQALSVFLPALAQGDRATVERMLRRDVLLLNDGAGEFFAARVPIVGAVKAATFLLHTTRRPLLFFRPISCNGLEGAIVEVKTTRDKEPPRAVSLFDVGTDGLISAIYTVVATRKLSGVAW